MELETSISTTIQGIAPTEILEKRINSMEQIEQEMPPPDVHLEEGWDEDVSQIKKLKRKVR